MCFTLVLHTSSVCQTGLAHSALSSHMRLVAIVLDSAVLTLGFRIEGTWQLRLCSPPLGP